jgi:hypothetical protein
MPKAAVDEHSHTLTEKDQVRSTAEPRQRCSVDAIAESQSMHKGPKGTLWSGSLPLLREHSASRLL